MAETNRGNYQKTKWKGQSHSVEKFCTGHHSTQFMNKNLMNEDKYIIKNLNYLCTVHWLTQTRRTLATLLFIKLIKMRRTLATLLFIKLIKTRRTLATLLFIKLIKTRRTLATLLFIKLIKTLYSYHLLAPTLFTFCLCSVCQGHKS